MGRRFQFSLKLPFILLASMIAGGQTARYIALSETPMLAGKPVAWSALGEAIFFGIGCLAAVAGVSIVAAGPSLLRIRAPWHHVPEERRRNVLLIDWCFNDRMLRGCLCFDFAGINFFHDARRTLRSADYQAIARTAGAAVYMTMLNVETDQTLDEPEPAIRTKRSGSVAKLSWSSSLTRSVSEEMPVLPKIATA